MQRSPERLRKDALSPASMARSGLCVGCGSCAERMHWDRNGFLKPAASAASTSSFALSCPFSPSAPNEDVIALERFGEAAAHDDRIGRFESTYVGHVAEEPFRRSGSSGGLTSWVAAELLRRGIVEGIAHVAPTDTATGRHFAYRISRSVEELSAGAKSRYYPVELSQVLAEIRAVPGRYAVVGIPCFIKAVHLLRRVDPLISERVTHTLGLFCGHMKSAAMVESFAWQLGIELNRVRALDYRVKDESRPANWYRTRLDLQEGGSVEQDWWHLADGDWGAGFFQNPACDWCDDVVAETADIAFGDAWVEPHSSDGRGTNVVVVRSKQLKALVEAARAAGRLVLEPVDAEFIVRTQAAGLRHRRDGLAYRLSWRRRGVVPKKRVRPSDALPLRRKLVYRLRHGIARWSHRLFRLARASRSPWIYTGWARAMLRLYQSVTWSRGRLGKLLDAALPRPEA
jgi:coenzyme F420-reducing hydrogenase beta subunit